MDYNVGDQVTSLGISCGTFLGEEAIQGKVFYKIQDQTSQSISYISVGDVSKIRPFPTKQKILKLLKVFQVNKPIDIGEVEGNRYKFFKDKLRKFTYKGLMEVFHDLCWLKKEKKISHSERKLWKDLQKKLVSEISFVLGHEENIVEELIQIKAA